jgi:hypothetical protein
MRTRIKYQSLPEKIWDRKKQLAQDIMSEVGCNMTRALKRVEFNLELNRV